MNSSTSFSPSIARSLQRLGLIPARSGVELTCKLAIASAGRTTTVFDLHRVVDVIADHCMMEDRFDHHSS